jgi:hypothetical protein
MTARRRTLPIGELREVLETLREFGVEIGTVEIRADGVTVGPANALLASGATKSAEAAAFDDWKTQDCDGPAHR